METDDTVGSVLVAGGGIAGMAASLDLAESGFKVYLLESSAAIGGKMVQLDKTFPTGDCAMCTIAPRLVECGRHHNIEIITNSSIEKLEGKTGNFKVTIKKHPLYVDEKKCNACGDCEKVCPVELDNSFDYGLSKRKAIYKLYPQAIPNIYTIDKDGVSPCRVACPAGINAHGYISLIRAGKYKEALDLIYESMPFPSACGRICTHPCEAECSRKEIDEPIAICDLKRFVADWGIKKMEDGSSGECKFAKFVDLHQPLHVAVIGSGPAGLTCAYYLLKMGYKITVFESMPVAGGMLRTAIPDFRLPKEVMDTEIEFIKNSGVDIKTNVTVGKDISFKDLQKDYSAIFIGVGAVKSVKLNIEGENLEGVYYGVDFLKEVKSGKQINVGSKVIVIGGGNTAIDSAMTSIRLGAKNVYIAYRRSREEMPAGEEEVEAASGEGIKFLYLTSPLEIIGSNGSVKSIKCIKMKLGEQDKTGRRKPVPIEGTESSLFTDTVIIATGQYSDISFLPDSFGLKDKNGNIKVNNDTLGTDVSGIFAGGDVIRGADVFINAVADGRKAAVSIDRFLRGDKLLPVILHPHSQAQTKKKPFKNVRRKNRINAETGFTMTEEMAKEEAERCLNCGVCSECLECVKVCEPKAIDRGMTEEIRDLNIGSVILSSGFETFDARIKEEYGYGRYKDVITSVEFERILSASGPYGGEIQRPSDGQIPKKIAFIQCVGSRDKAVNREYCSAVCCMYTAKEAIVTKEHIPDADITVFFIDIRAYGKGYEEYYERAKNEYGVKYKRCSISKIIEHPKTKKLRVKYIDPALSEKTLRKSAVDANPERVHSIYGVTEDDFDLIVLAVGMQPSNLAIELNKKIGINFDKYNFVRNTTDGIYSSITSIDGVFVAGTIQGPKDIPESIVQGLSSASDASSVLSSARHTLTVKKEYPEERDVADVKERIGVFVCHCGRNISSVVDVDEVANSVRNQQGVVHSETNIFTCSPDGLEKIRCAIKEHNLNRVVVASCSPRTHELLFQENLKETGLNPYLFEMANIRDQCSWVHFSEPDKATLKAKSLVMMAVNKSRYLEPLKMHSIPVVQKALVIGGGLCGMVASLSLAEQGFEVFLIEKERELGGNLRKTYYTLEGQNVQKILTGLIDKIKKNELIKIFTNTEIKEVSGFVGNFKTTIQTNSELHHGVIVVATGGEEYKPKEYLYGKDQMIITQRELEEKLFNHSTIQPFNHSTVVMIQCVGSRNDEHPYCSRICCTEAVKNALKIKELNPKINIFILHHDIRTYGMKELYYEKAREAGINFIRHPDEELPIITSENGQLKVMVKDTSLDRELIINPDLLVLSTGIVPYSSNTQLASLLKVPLNEVGFFLEAHIKLRPVDFTSSGIYLCGLAHSPKFIDENISQAKAAVSRATTILSKDHLEAGGVVAFVDKEKCAVCLTCIRVCPYGVPSINVEGVAEIEPVKCQGCGICASQCPAKAIQLQQFKDIQIIAECEGIVRDHRTDTVYSQSE